jgi:ribA/ribD-fused uncharacterized protein
MSDDVKGFFKTYRFLSNFYKASFVDDDDVQWETSEHYYQAGKFTDETFIEEVRNTPLKKLKKKAYSKKSRLDWNEIKIEVMRKALRYKFTQNEDIRKLLLDTGNSHLEETNTWKDFFWGVCYGLGDNHLGILLMELREELRE